MKTLTLFSLITLFSLTTIAQTHSIDGSNGIKFGMTKEEVKALILKKGWKIYTPKEKDNNTIFISKSTVGGLDCTMAAVEFFKNKAFEIYFDFDKSLEYKIKSIIAQKYGPCSKIDTGKVSGQIKYIWDFAGNKRIRITTASEDDVAKDVILDYRDNDMYEKRQKYLESINNKAF